MASKWLSSMIGQVPVVSSTGTTESSRRSSSLTPPPSFSQHQVSVESKFLPVKPLDEELAQHVTTYFEEGLHYQALNLLSSLLAASIGSNKTVEIPQSFHLSFIMTLSLHPRFSMHASTDDKRRVSTMATAYLSSLVSVVGPIAAGLARAYVFDNHMYMRGGRRRAVHIDSEGSDDSGAQPLESDLARAQDFFKRADDFWAALGWALTCSVLYPTRWEIWSLWCSHMIDIIEQDWKLRATPSEMQDPDWPRETLLVQYIGSNSSTQVKRIVRSIFAAGTGQEFSEIWKDETLRKRKKAVDFSNRGTLNIEAGQLADYGGMSSDDENVTISDDESQPEHKHISTLGPPEALRFRMRLLALLATLSLTATNHIVSIEALYIAFQSHLRPLPLETFHKLLTPHNLAYFSTDSASSLIQYLARSFLEPAAPPSSIDDLTWDSISRSYAPYASAGNTVGDNGKIGVCVEALIGLARRKLGFSPLRGVSIAAAKEQGNELWAAVEKGCQRRQDKAGNNVKRAKKGEAGAEFDFETAREFEVVFLRGARMRLALLLGMKIA